jgi:hypothetical protein
VIEMAYNELEQDENEILDMVDTEWAETKARNRAIHDNKDLLGRELI